MCIGLPLEPTAIYLPSGDQSTDNAEFVTVAVAIWTNVLLIVSKEKSKRSSVRAAAAMYLPFGLHLICLMVSCGFTSGVATCTKLLLVESNAYTIIPYNGSSPKSFELVNPATICIPSELQSIVDAPKSVDPTIAGGGIGLGVAI